MPSQHQEKLVGCCTMEEGLAIRLATLRPAIIARWTALLHAEVPASPRRGGLVTAAMLDFMPAETLDHLAASLIRAPDSMGAAARLSTFGAMRGDCPCGLDLLLTYYRTGERALRETLPDQFDLGREKLLRNFDQLAHEEMNALCGVCLHRGHPPCRLKPLIADKIPAPRPIP